ncbi:Monothiol glutaredoxin-7 [Fulvia fulva]|uniref:Monothiol glutaredoxin-7 n=1 Tax=Passalora fulva TaxID=5499 RepID=A0A9Q8L5S2_PASFU|nr:Monothiol glutaredoxin-7 [Fulvia fulva]UJO11336.1 Monothiol glutaredoxin-7 [Fulvia fulva]WPV23806.1 Monothiol glutaredoxin-7 [Fulvia fulva]
MTLGDIRTTPIQFIDVSVAPLVLLQPHSLHHLRPFRISSDKPPLPFLHLTSLRQPATMPSGRQFKVIGLVTLLVVLALYYVTNGEQLTHESEFYKKTVKAMEHKKTAAEKQATYVKEKETQERIERLQKEHDAATATLATSESTEAAAPVPRPQKQKPIVGDAPTSGEKSVAGRKKMQDGKIVDKKPATDNDDGVAKVGNVASKTSSASKGDSEETESEEDHEVETELNDILKKGPIIVFSKSYCPFSKKAKHILLDLYTISPKPYIVELDQHKLGSGLQDALLKSTGRRTVPNVLINGKSIGGGDDVQALHDNDKVIDTIKAMGGKRIVSVEKNQDAESGGHRETRAEVKFKA